ncbi:MAG TPA: hypothetical protein VD731_03175 [Nitrosopumilaceae archaeon]|nr:hypothetical protein [Nitrosopumilaceae archaeon]
MTNLNSRNISKDLKKIRRFSSIIEKKISQLDNNDESKIEKLSLEQLQDLNQLVHVANYILTKYEDNKEVYQLLKDFVEMISNSTESMGILNDKISELVVSAENSISRIKNIQGEVSDGFSLFSTQGTLEKKSEFEPKLSTKNLTKSATPVYT